VLERTVISSARRRFLARPARQPLLSRRLIATIWANYGPNVIVDCMPLPLKERATLFRDGSESSSPRCAATVARRDDASRQDAKLSQSHQS